MGLLGTIGGIAGGLTGSTVGAIGGAAAGQAAGGGNAMGVLDPFNLTGWKKGPGIDWASAPQAPSYIAPDAEKSQIGPQQYAQLDKEGLNRFKQEAFRDPGVESKFASLAKSRNQQGMLQGQDQARQMAGGQTATAMSRLGGAGVTGGAAERIAKGGSRNAMDAIQKLGAQGTMNNTNIDIADEQSRLAMLGQVPGMDQSFAQTQHSTQVAPEMARQQFNATQARGLAQDQNQFNWQTFNTQAPIWGGMQAMNVMENRPKSGLAGLPIVGGLFG